MLLAASGGGAVEPGLYAEDVFGIHTRTGNGSNANSNVPVVNGMDLAGEGGFVWVKERNSSNAHTLLASDLSTVSGIRQYLTTNAVHQANHKANGSININFNSNGYTIRGFDGQVNQNSGNTYVDWAFRKAPGFLDVVTWTGNGVQGREISHSLGSVPGMIFIKRTDTSGHWIVYHRSIGAFYHLRLNETQPLITSNQQFSNIEPTSSVFTVHDDGSVNLSGGSYIAYVFAHDDQSFGTTADESIIKCGSYSSTGFVDLGWEPQWVMIKSVSEQADYRGDWRIYDNIRGITEGDDHQLFANDSRAEDTNNFATAISLNATGFTVEGQGNYGTSTVYMAIRRPHKPPTAGTDVFKAITRNGTQADASITGFGFVPDLFMSRARNNLADQQWQVFDRLRGPLIVLSTRYQSAESSYPRSLTSFDQDGVSFGNDTHAGGLNYTGGQYVYHTFSRAAGVFDVVAYDGTASALAVNHNLAAIPELIIVKCRSNNGQWGVYDATNGPTKAAQLNSNSRYNTTQSYWNSTAPTKTQFTVNTDGAVNDTGQKYVAYLFASQTGISKVGSYTGTGNAINVDCGFSYGARYILIKRTDTSGDWYVWDTTRGIVSGNDPYLLINGGAAEVTDTDYIDPLNAGFTVTSSAPAALNTSGGTYIFLAIA